MRPVISKMDFSHSSLFGYIEDLQELTIIERPVRRSLKTPEEIERLTVDEELSDIERAVYLLRRTRTAKQLCISTKSVSRLMAYHKTISRLRGAARTH